MHHGVLLLVAVPDGEALDVRDGLAVPVAVAAALGVPGGVGEAATKAAERHGSATPLVAKVVGTVV